MAISAVPWWSDESQVRPAAFRKATVEPANVWALVRSQPGAPEDGLRYLTRLQESSTATADVFRVQAGIAFSLFD